jgi:hypothetical protein
MVRQKENRAMVITALLLDGSHTLHADAITETEQEGKEEIKQDLHDMSSRKGGTERMYGLIEAIIFLLLNRRCTHSVLNCGWRSVI